MLAFVLAFASGLESGKTGGPFGYSLVLPLALLGTLPLALVRRRPSLAIGIVLAANSAFVLFGRLSWPAGAIVGWLIGLAASPVLLRRRPALVAVTLSEIAVLVASLDLGANARTKGSTTGPAGRR